MVSAVIGKKAIIEDSNEDCWEVSVSNVDGSPAFRQGWNAFSAHHRLEIGDFLVFDYIMGSHFVVKIYDKTGCEKQKFSLITNKRKRYRTTTNFTDREGQCYTADKGLMSKERKNARTNTDSTDREGQCYIGNAADKDSMSKERSSPSFFSVSDEEMSESQCELNDVEKASTNITSNCKISGKRPLSVSRAKFLEGPYYLIDRDLADQQRENRCSVFDLSHFEMVGNNFGTAIRDKMKVGDDYSHHTDASLMSEFENVLVNKYPVNEEILNRVAASDASDVGVEKMEKIITGFELQNDEGNNSNVSSGVSQKCHGAEEESKALSS